MTYNLSSTLFMLTLMTGSVISISTTSWVMMWIGLEMNLLSFIPMMNKNSSPYESEASMKYFLTQAMASMGLLSAILTSEMKDIKPEWTNMILLMTLLMKMGAAPFHFWFPSVMQGLTWMNCTILMTWQKIAPMVMLSYQFMNHTVNSTVIILSLITGSVGGLNQTSMRKMMAYSSISHMGWMMSTMYLDKNYWTAYFMMYSVLNIAVIIILQNNKMYHISQIFTSKMSKNNKFMLFISMLSLGGLPPFLGFMPKWIVIQIMIFNQNITMVLIMVMTTLLTLYFYLRMMYSAFTFNNQSSTWQNEKSNKSIMLLTTMTSTMGIPIISMINLY